MHAQVITIPVEEDVHIGPREVMVPQHFVPSEVCAKDAF